MSSFTVSTVWGAGGVADCRALRPAAASTPATAAHSRVTISAASHSGRKLSSTMISSAVRAPSASSAVTAAPTSMPAPLPASLPFSVTSAWASLISWRTSVEVWLARSLTSSPMPRSRGSVPADWAPPLVGSCVAMARLDPRVAAGEARAGPAEVAADRPPGAAEVAADRSAAAADDDVAADGPPAGGQAGRGADVLPARGQVARALPARLIAAAARRLEEARGGEPEREAAGDDRPRLPAPEVLQVAQDRVTVRARQIIAQRLR